MFEAIVGWGVVVILGGLLIAGLMACSVPLTYRKRTLAELNAEYFLKHPREYRTKKTTP